MRGTEGPAWLSDRQSHEPLGCPWSGGADCCQGRKLSTTSNRVANRVSCDPHGGEPRTWVTGKAMAAPATSDVRVLMVDCVRLDADGRDCGTTLAVLR